MRGKDHFSCPFGLDARITPAYAGKRKMRVLQMLVTMGSPPPMRGKGPQLKACTFFTGITPAYAGKSKLNYRLNPHT